MSIASYLIESGAFKLYKLECVYLLLAGVYQKHQPAFISPAGVVFTKNNEQYLYILLGFTKNIDHLLCISCVCFLNLRRLYGDFGQNEANLST